MYLVNEIGETADRILGGFQIQSSVEEHAKELCKEHLLRMVVLEVQENKLQPPTLVVTFDYDSSKNKIVEIRQ